MRIANNAGVEFLGFVGRVCTVAREIQEQCSPNSPKARARWFEVVAARRGPDAPLALN